jgi:hypothetical protein
MEPGEELARVCVCPHAHAWRFHALHDSHGGDAVPDHSYRSASIGSIREAFTAG